MVYWLSFARLAGLAGIQRPAFVHLRGSLQLPDTVVAGGPGADPGERDGNRHNDRSEAHSGGLYNDEGIPDEKR